jgi:hypothetical protein
MPAFKTNVTYSPTPHPKNSPFDQQSSPHASAKSNPPQPSFTERAKQLRPRAPKFFTYSPPSMPTTPRRRSLRDNEAEEASWSVLHAELMRQAEHTRHLEAAHGRATAELSTLREHHTAIEVLREENRAFERYAASTDELREPLEAEVEAARTEPEAWCVSPSCVSLFFGFVFIV